MGLPRETLERAFAVLRAVATDEGDVRIVTDPWSALERAGCPRDAVAALLASGTIVGLGRMRFRVTDAALAEAAPTPPAGAHHPRPCVLLVVDVENVLHAHRDAGAPFEPGRIRAAANRVGPVGFAFALANFNAVTPRDRAALALAGFHTVHCEPLVDGAAGKDTVDNHLRDLVLRFLDHAAISAIVLMSDDRDFAPVLTAAHDRSVRAVVLSYRERLALGTLAEHRTLPLTRAPRAPRATPTRRWNPEDAYAHLERMSATADPAEQRTVIDALRTHAPLPHRVLRSFARKYLVWWGRQPLSFLGLVTVAERTLDSGESLVTRDMLHQCFSVLVTMGVITRTSIGREDAERVRYEPTWTHPYIADAVRDIGEQSEGTKRQRVRKYLSDHKRREEARATQGERAELPAQDPTPTDLP